MKLSYVMTFVGGVSFTVGLLIAIATFSHGNELSNGEYSAAILGVVDAYKINESKYRVRYESYVDKVRTQVDIDGEFELGQIKTIINAAVNKEYKFILIHTDCVDNILKEMRGENKSYHYCQVYGSHKIALKTYDRDLLIDELVRKIKIPYEQYAKIVKRN